MYQLAMSCREIPKHPSLIVIIDTGNQGTYNAVSDSLTGVSHLFPFNSQHLFKNDYSPSGTKQF